MSLVVENKRPVFTLFVLTAFGVSAILSIILSLIYFFYKIVERDLPSNSHNYAGGGILEFLAIMAGLFAIVITVNAMVEKITK